MGSVVSSVEDWLASSSGEDGCRGDSQATVWKHSTDCHVQRRLASVSARLFRLSVGSARIRRRWMKQHGVADSSDPEAGGLGFSHGRMVLRPRSEHIRQRFTPLHLAVSAMFPLHTVHGEWCCCSF